MIIVLTAPVFAQVDIHINILPPYPSKITDYASHPQQVLILVRNASNLATDVQFRGSITGDNGIILRVNPQYKSPAPIHLNPGQTLNLNGSDISQLFDYNQLVFSGISRDQAAIVVAYGHALSTTFLAGAVFAAVACIVVALSPERPLSATRRP